MQVYTMKNKTISNNIMTDDNIQAFNQEKQEVIKLIESMPYERALRYIERELSDLKNKNNKMMIQDSTKLLKKKRTEINRKIKKQEKQSTYVDVLLDENKQLKQTIKELRSTKKELQQRLKETRQKSKDSKVFRDLHKDELKNLKTEKKTSY